MSNFGYAFGKALSAFRAYRNVGDSFVSGEIFENYLRRCVFPKKDFECLHRTHAIDVNAVDYVSSSLWPDFMFAHKGSGEVFFLEAKYRSTMFNGKINVCSNNQIERYRLLDKSTPVYIALGYGGIPGDCDKLFVIPVRELRYIDVYPSVIEKYSIPVRTSCFSAFL